MDETQALSDDDEHEAAKLLLDEDQVQFILLSFAFVYMRITFCGCPTC